MLGATFESGKLTSSFQLRLFDGIPFPVFACDEQGVIRYTNRAFERMAGFEDEDYIERSTLSDLENIFSVELERPAHRVLTNEEIYQSPSVVVAGFAGNFLFLSVTLVPIISDGARVGCLGIVRDQTDAADATDSLQRRLRELSIIEEISQALHSTMKTEDILRIILTGVTCKEGLGFNRAFLFLIDESSHSLQGKLAIGPSNAEEAGRIWGNMDQQQRTLPAVLDCYLENLGDGDIEVNRIVRSLRIELSEKTIFREVVESGKWRNVEINFAAEGHEAEIFRQLNSSRCAIVPLLSRGKSIGIILADNLITGKWIEDNTVRLLQIFADHAASAIENARLYEALAVKATSLEQSNRKLEQVQRQIAAIEKSSLMGEITYKIAHELRNPITIIGGFSSLLNHNLDSADRLTEYAGIIVEETLRVERALTEVLNFSKSFAQEKQFVNLYDVLKDTVDVLEQRHALGEVIIEPAADQSFLVRVNRDQTVQSLYDVAESVSALLPRSAAIKLGLISDEGVHRIELKCVTDEACRNNIDNFLRAMLNNQTTGASLRMTLAFETIRYNGGEPGIAVSETEGSYLYIEYPAMEENRG